MTDEEYREATADCLWLRAKWEARRAATDAAFADACAVQLSATGRYVRSLAGQWLEVTGGAWRRATFPNYPLFGNANGLGEHSWRSREIALAVAERYGYSWRIGADGVEHAYRARDRATASLQVMSGNRWQWRTAAPI